MNTFNAYALSANYEYDIVNSSAEETRAEFHFPISSASKLYQDIIITANKRAIPWRITNQAIFWEAGLSTQPAFS